MSSYVKSFSEVTGKLMNKNYVGKDRPPPQKKNQQMNDIKIMFLMEWRREHKTKAKGYKNPIFKKTNGN